MQDPLPPPHPSEAPGHGVVACGATGRPCCCGRPRCCRLQCFEMKRWYSHGGCQKKPHNHRCCPGTLAFLGTQLTECKAQPRPPNLPLPGPMLPVFCQKLSWCPLVCFSCHNNTSWPAASFPHSYGGWAQGQGVKVSTGLGLPEASVVACDGHLLSRLLHGLSFLCEHLCITEILFCVEDPSQTGLGPPDLITSLSPCLCTQSHLSWAGDSTQNFWLSP
jgi:hypothetical protein